MSELELNQFSIISSENIENELPKGYLYELNLRIDFLCELMSQAQQTTEEIISLVENEALLKFLKTHLKKLNGIHRKFLTQIFSINVQRERQGSSYFQMHEQYIVVFNDSVKEIFEYNSEFREKLLTDFAWYCEGPLCETIIWELSIKLGNNPKK